MYTVQITEVSAQPLAVVRDRATAGSLSQKIPELLGIVWEHIRAAGVAPAGHNVVVYLPEESKAECFAGNGMAIEAGVEVPEAFAGIGERVVRSATPAGQAASVLHVGPYHRISEANEALRKWCSENGHTLAGPSWEVYGHWTSNSEEPRTEIFYLLKPKE